MNKRLMLSIGKVKRNDAFRLRTTLGTKTRLGNIPKKLLSKCESLK